MQQLVNKIETIKNYFEHLRWINNTLPNFYLFRLWLTCCTSIFLSFLNKTFLNYRKKKTIHFQALHNHFYGCNIFNNSFKQKIGQKNPQASIKGPKNLHRELNTQPNGVGQKPIDSPCKNYLSLQKILPKNSRINRIEQI